jgi:uncharacterized protein (DUF1330 family)
VTVNFFVDPEREQFEAFKKLPRDEPIMMLNMIRLRSKAVYEDFRDATGAEAYAAYGRESAPIFRRVGGEIVWRGKADITVIGPPEEQWDLVFVARYPTASAFMEMVTDPAYRIAVKHRHAGVLDSRLVRLSDIPTGRGFAG